MSLSKELLEILACPKCKQEIKISDDEKWLICNFCKLKYPIREDIPVMLVEEAEKLDE
ncbi:MAG: Trm112 family protein [Proteobacteria bacterium]|nr:Trm112 family protein [Pseudomonadota bacterium]